MPRTFLAVLLLLVFVLGFGAGAMACWGPTLPRDLAMSLLANPAVRALLGS